MTTIKLIEVTIPKNSLFGYVVINDMKLNTFMIHLYRLLYSLLAYRCIGVKALDGTSCSLNRDDFTWGSPGDSITFVLCQENSFVGFNATRCTSVKSYEDVSVNYADTGNSMVIEGIRTVDANANSLLIAFKLRCFYGTIHYDRNFAISHVVKDISSGQVVRYKITVGQPWVKNFGLILAGLLKDENIDGVVDVVGTTFTARTSDKVVSAPAFLAVGYSNNPWSWNDNELRYEIDLNTWWTYIETDNGIVILATGVYKPDNEVDIGEMGLIQSVYDNNGNTHKVLLLRYVFPQPIHLTPQDIVVFGLKIVGGTV